MKLVTELEPQDKQVVVTLQELSEFRRIGKLLAEVIDSKRGTADNKISVEADGFLRIYSWNDEVIDMTSYVGGLIDTINDLEPEHQDIDDDEDDDVDSDDPDEYQNFEYEQATDYKKGVRVVAAKDITCADIYGAINDDDIDDFVVVPEGTTGVVLDVMPLSRNLSVAFEHFQLPARSYRPRSWNSDNRRSYKRELVEIPSYSCQCSFCLKQQLESVKDYPR